MRFVRVLGHNSNVIYTDKVVIGAADGLCGADENKCVSTSQRLWQEKDVYQLFPVPTIGIEEHLIPLHSLQGKRAFQSYENLSLT
jgi:hypothetical protein